MNRKVWVLISALPLTVSITICTTAMANNLERLGKELFQDTRFSFNQSQSCQSCHHPQSGFADPANAMDPENSVVSTGADGFSTGTRNAPTAAYAGMNPERYEIHGTDVYFGGLFWDSRATGYDTGLADLIDPLAEQAQGPPLNPVEMAMSSKKDIVAILEQHYRAKFNSVFGFSDFEDIDTAYALFGVAIAAYERSFEVMPFNSDFDRDQLTASAQQGAQLFLKHCNSCHSMNISNFPGAPFTTFGYENLGLPENPDLLGDENDLGLGAIVGERRHDGKFKIPTLRNVAKTPPYGHNGYFSSLREMVDFINSRDSMGFTPDVNRNITQNVGNLGLTENQVKALLAFLESLSDN